MTLHLDVILHKADTQHPCSPISFFEKEQVCGIGERVVLPLLLQRESQIAPKVHIGSPQTTFAVCKNAETTANKLQKHR